MLVDDLHLKYSFRMGEGKVMEDYNTRRMFLPL